MLNQSVISFHKEDQIISSIWRWENWDIKRLSPLAKDLAPEVEKLEFFKSELGFKSIHFLGVIRGGNPSVPGRDKELYWKEENNLDSTKQKIPGL